MNDFNYDNEIIEVSDDTNNFTEPTSTLEDLIKREAEKGSDNTPKKKKNKLSKKQIIVIIISIILVLIIAGVILYFFLKEDKEPVKNEEPVVIIEKDNYRYENGSLVFLDNSEKELGTYECKNKDIEKCHVTKINLNNDGFDRVKSVYEDGTELEKNSKIYYDKYVFVTDGEIIYLYNMETKETELEFQNIKSYDTKENVIVVENDKNLYGLLEIKEDGHEYLIRCSYDNLGIVNSDKLLLVAQDKDAKYIIDSTGKKLSKNIKVDIKSADENFVVGITNDSYSLYSYEYDELISEYDYISLHNDVIALVKNKRLYLVSSNLNKLYEDGIRLENTDYNKKYVYNGSNRLIDTLKSYEIEVEENIVSVTIGNDTKEINILEGEISGTLTYLSYYDGKIYFYSDEDKIDLLGTYTCNNKNNIATFEDGLTTCNIYANELGVSGIYNNEYVFIYDSNNTPTYYLYNLKEGKVKGTYSDIKILNDKDLNTNVKPIYTSSSFIIAKAATGSNKGNYGVLEINGEKVQGKVGFKYESIEFIKDYYQLISVDKSYSIYDKNFNKISNEFSYLELYDKYYVGISNNKLNVYSYNNTLGILESDIGINNTTFDVDFTDGFMITIGTTTYKYDKNGKIKNDIVEQPNEDSEEDVEEGVNNGE